MKQTFIVLAGFIGTFILEGFTRLVILFYHRSDFIFYGISELPADSWIIILHVSVLFSTWLCTMLVLTLTEKSILQTSFIFGVLFTLFRIMEAIRFASDEPLWYYLSIITIHLTAIWLAYFTFKKSIQHGSQR